jgi:hypothetical protein
MNYSEREIKSFGKELNEFCSRYRAYPRQGQPVRRSKKLNITDWVNPKDEWTFANLPTYEVPTVDLNISEEDLKKLFDDLAEVDSGEYKEYLRTRKVLGDHFMLDLYEVKGRQAREERARQANPGVQKAWENYQMMLKLAGG